MVLFLVTFCFPSSLVHFPFSFPVAPEGRVATTAMWTEVADREAKFPAAFGAHIGLSIEPCRGLPSFLLGLDIWYFRICFQILLSQNFLSRDTPLPSLRTHRVAGSGYLSSALWVSFVFAS